jgi:TPR repeat protein
LLTKSFDGKKVVSVSVEKNNQSLLKVWDFSKNKDLVDEEKELFEFEEKHKVSSVIFSPDGEKLLTRCYQKKAGKSQKETPLSIWNVGTGKKIISLLDDNNNQNQLTTIAFSIGDKIGISREGIDDNNSDIRYVNQQATLNIIDLSINKEIKIFAYKTNDKGSIGFNNSSVPIVFSPDGKIIASAHCIVHNGKIKENENPIELWDTEKGEKIFSFDGHGKVLPVGLDGGRRIIPQEADTAVSALAFNHDGTMLASGSRDGSIKLWEISPKKNNSDSKDSVSSPTETRQDPTGLTPSTRNEQFTFNKQDPSKQSTTEIKPPVKEPIPPDDINEYYGVVAISQNTGRYGFCFAHHKDKQEAANHALSFCNARDAKVVLCVKNQWFALASGGGGAFGWAHGSDPDKVRERAINECLRFSNTAQIVVLDHSNNKNHLNQSLKSTSTNPGWDKSDVSSDIKKDYDKILNSHHKGFISELKNTFAEFPDIRILVWKNAAEIGNTHAMVLYAKHLEYAQTPDLEKSLNYMKKAAQNEDAFAMTELAYFYIYGKGIPKNIDEGIQWLRKASELEDPQAMSSLAYYFRDKYKDSENSFFWAKKGSNLGNTNAIIQLAHCYYQGFGVDKNEAECFRLYLKAADLGNSLSVNNVGVCYAKGIGVDKDDKKSFEMYLKSAELGLLSGMYNVANCYKNGKGTSEDREKAIEWYKKSAKYGEERSRKTLKEMGIDY